MVMMMMMMMGDCNSVCHLQLRDRNFYKVTNAPPYHIYTAGSKGHRRSLLALSRRNWLLYAFRETVEVIV